jgi:hypothetical protein
LEGVKADAQGKDDVREERVGRLAEQQQQVYHDEFTDAAVAIRPEVEIARPQPERRTRDIRGSPVVESLS